jgi:hypothetical protein
MSDELQRALAGREVDVTELLRRAEADARVEVEEILRRAFVDDLLRRATAQLGGRDVVALAGVADGVRPLVLELNARDLDDESRLESLLRAHNELLMDALAAGAVVPFRFGTTYESRSALDDWVAQHHDELARELDRLRGTAEWSVEVLGGRAAGSYLEERLATAVRPDTLAAASLERNGNAYLVADRERFGAAIDALEAEGYEVRVTGPWPPYSFARLP